MKPQILKHSPQTPQINLCNPKYYGIPLMYHYIPIIFFCIPLHRHYPMMLPGLLAWSFYFITWHSMHLWFYKYIGQ